MSSVFIFHFAYKTQFFRSVNSLGYSANNHFSLWLICHEQDCKEQNLQTDQQDMAVRFLSLAKLTGITFLHKFLGKAKLSVVEAATTLSNKQKEY